MSEAPPDAPLVILANHRSGSSAFMSLLADAGLLLGEVIPPAPDNPRGFFENREIVEVNRRLMDERGRDWTCPPPSLDHRTVDLEPLRDIGAELTQIGRPWGFKDPRVLFTLPAWAAALGSCRLVGVHRNSNDVARSLTARGRFTFGQAKDIALAYAERLAEAHRRLGFPVVSFDDEPRRFIERTGSVAEAVGLDWDRETWGSLYELDLIHHRSPDECDNPVDEYLSEAAKDDIVSVPTRTASTVVRIWEGLPSERARSLPRHLGPRYERVRSELTLLARRHLPETSDLALVEPEERTIQLLGAQYETMTLKDFWEEGETRLESGERWSHVVAPSLLDEIAPQDFVSTLKTVFGFLEDRAVVALGGWVLDGDQLPSANTFSLSEVKAHRNRKPYLHHVDEIITSLMGHGLYPVQVERKAGQRTHLLIANDRVLAGEHMTPHQLRQTLADLEDKLSRLAGELERATADAASEYAAISAELAEVSEQRRRLQSELAMQSEAIDELESQLAEVRSQLATSNGKLASAEERLKEAESRFKRLKSRRAVRLALRFAEIARPLVRLTRRLRSPQVTRRGEEPSSPSTPGLFRPYRSRRAQSQLARRLKTTRHGSPAETGPKVSIVILTRDGAHHMERLLTALDDNTRYRSFEVIVVDNGSTDQTPELLSVERNYPVKVIRNECNTSFSAGNNQGVEVAEGELLLFLNNDLEPINPGWLGALVQEATVNGVVAVGAELVYPVLGERRADLTVQHSGIRFVNRDGAAHPKNVGGGDPLASKLTGSWEVPAATAATLMVDAAVFTHVGGFDEGYVYGAEDVDLCLKLREHGKVVVTGQAVLFHYESSTQKEMASNITSINRTGNWQRFSEVWGPRLARSVMRDRLNGRGYWTFDGDRTVAITLTHDDASRGWGDYYTAHELGDAFEAAGWKVLYAERYEDHWYDLEDDVDLVISLLDSYDVRRAPEGAFTIAWVRNWVDRWLEQPSFESFDSIATSSHKAAGEIRRRSSFNPKIVPLATNPERFYPGPATPAFEADYVFTGNNWGPGRKLIHYLDVHPDERFLLFGRGWEKDSRIARYWRGAIDYDLLPEVYRSAEIVLDDTADPTLPHAFLNGRVFDALASGALVISDNIEGSEEMFDGLLPTYSDAESLRDRLDHFLNDEEGRTYATAQLREAVLERHNYADRPAEFVSHALDQIERPHAAIKIAVPNDEVKPKWGDTHFGNGLASALAKQGIPTDVHILPEWDLRSNQAADVVIHLRGLTRYAPKPAHINVLWIISHPDDVSPRECEKYDLVLVASQTHANWLESRVDKPVAFLPQATDHRRFFPGEPVSEFETDVLFVGNSRGQDRPVVAWAIDRDLPLTIYGSGWENRVTRRFLTAEHFPNERLSALYGSAKVVLNDHWPDMRDRGFISNRIFDAMASGAVVVSDRVHGLEEVFGDLVPTYSSPQELEEVVGTLLGDDQLRSRLGSEGAKLVADRHTFEHRAEQLIELIGPVLLDRPKDLGSSLFGPLR